ncbi:MAG: phosphatidylserine/phosphatidylglycerophosphate/cardiolipin synthase family protein [Myxococcales bacterium]|nr:phosphatidylserine/phosphatidylglycerophosphate/cardiolipin synthase family protein [Myxococcales bacterium]
MFAPEVTVTLVDTVTLLRDGEEAFPAMLAALDAAEHEVLIEMYWFDDSPVARRMVDIMARKARAGVKVRVSYDAIGSISGDRAMYAPLLDAGGEVREYNPIAPWRRRFALTRVSQRDHRKIIVVDGRVGFCGGLNIGLPWMPASEGGGGWRDDVARIEGPAVEGLRRLFFETWAVLGGALPANIERPMAREIRRDIPLVMGRVTAATSVLGHDAWGAQRAIRRAYLSRLRRATRRIYLANSYFLPDPTVRRALEQAARRKVEVRVVVPKVSDVAAVLWAGQSLYRRLLMAGVHIHEYTRGILHAKSGLIDDWATVGSYNLDYISLRQNLEANLVSTDPAFVHAMEASFQRDFSTATEEVLLARWVERSFVERLRSRFFYQLRKFL